MRNVAATPLADERAHLASRIAEYLSLARTLNEKSSAQEYRTANALAWELAMVLPADVYRMMTRVLVGKDQAVNAHTFAIYVRKWLLGDDAGDLNSEELAHHAPGIGKR